ncbi:uncharacterized protein LOC108676242 [Hyalella azteca]|uniref:Uncharacterized protein LOC108676242 n=1 Tax=Hyalella azteca TaxID=294128 RepID=A0A8B7P408_HYAAZ|nr:uncharacterized protein LOC108676242 [Hyalella azteca]
MEEQAAEERVVKVIRENPKATRKQRDRAARAFELPTDPVVSQQSQHQEPLNCEQTLPSVPDHSPKMPRGLVLLMVAAAAASAQAADSPCYSVMFNARDAVYAKGVPACLPQYTADIAKYNANPNCATFAKSPDMDTCDSIVANFSKCLVKAVNLLKADNTFDDAAFKATTLQNKCSADAKFISVYPTCKNSTMKYLNLIRLINCIHNNLYGYVISRQNMDG